MCINCKLHWTVWKAELIKDIGKGSIFPFYCCCTYFIKILESLQNYIFYNVEHEKNLVIADMSKHFFLLQNQNQIGRCNCDFYWNILLRWKSAKFSVFCGFSWNKLTVYTNENVSRNINKLVDKISEDGSIHGSSPVWFSWHGPSEGGRETSARQSALLLQQSSEAAT